MDNSVDSSPCQEIMIKVSHFTLWQERGEQETKERIGQKQQVKKKHCIQAHAHPQRKGRDKESVCMQKGGGGERGQKDTVAQGRLLQLPDASSIAIQETLLHEVVRRVRRFKKIGQSSKYI